MPGWDSAHTLTFFQSWQTERQRSHRTNRSFPGPMPRKSPLSRFLKKAGKTVMTSSFTPGSQNGEENELVDNYYSASCDAVDVCHANMFQVP